MKLSNYNFFYETFNKTTSDVEYIAYNSRTNALAIMNLDEFNNFNNNSTTDFDALDTDLKDNLLKGGFILKDDVNELEIIKLANLSTKFTSESLTLTIAPTLQCNFQCIYCFENSQDNKLKMPKEIQDQLVQYIENRSNALKELHITWYGGEPLLAFDVIEYLTENILAICNKNNIKYTASIVTNGYNLTPEIDSKFKDLCIYSAQITLDGPPEIHNMRRPLKTGQPTFDKIIDNIYNTKNDSYSISLRINVDKDNSNELDNILTILNERDLLKKISVYLGHVLPSHDCYQDSTCLSLAEFTELNFNFLYKLKALINKKVFLDAYPKLHSVSCCADMHSSLVIDAEGNLYKCWNDIGRKEFSFGKITAKTEASPIFNSYVLYDCTSDEKCVNCKVLPLCMGGCAKRRLDKIEARCAKLLSVNSKLFKCFIEEKIS